MSARSTAILAFQVLAVVLWAALAATLIAAAALILHAVRRLSDMLRRRTARAGRQQAEDAELKRRYRAQSTDELDLHTREEGRP